MRICKSRVCVNQIYNAVGLYMSKVVYAKRCYLYHNLSFLYLWKEVHMDYEDYVVSFDFIKSDIKEMPNY